MNNPKPYIGADGEVRELDDNFFANAKVGRPPLPSEQRKQKISIMLDPDIIDRLKSDGKGWQTRANALLRKALAL